MDAEKVVEELTRRFRAPLPEHYDRRIIFWQDEEKEFQDLVKDLKLDHVRILMLDGTNNFAAKKLLTVDAPHDDFLVYQPFSCAPGGDWLLDMKLYSESFRADLISIWMEEMGLPDTPNIRQMVKKYQKFFNARSRREKVMAFDIEPTIPARLHQAVMAAVEGISDINPSSILRAMLERGVEEDSNPLYREMVNYGAHGTFWRMVEQGTGYKENQPSLLHLSRHILLTALSGTVHVPFPSSLASYVSKSHEPYCYDFVSEWMRSGHTEKLKELAMAMEEDLDLPAWFSRIPVDELVETEIFPSVDEVILSHIMEDVGNDLVDIGKIRKIAEKRRTTVWYKDRAVYYEGLLQLANMEEFSRTHAESFHTVLPKNVWEEYTKDYYKMDTFYRLFRNCYTRSLQSYDGDLQEHFAAVAQRAEGMYTQWFLKNLGENWINAAGDDLAKDGYISSVPRQEDFYRTKVAPEGNRIIVIISDALRYETAVSLAEALRQDQKCRVQVSSMQAIFPTITKFGMAALLPHKELTVEITGTEKTERLSVLADGMRTDSSYREKLLKRYNAASVVLRYRDLLPLKKVERKALVKGKEVVYIYHDTIDHTSHNDESKVFEACDRAIEEIINLIHIITNEFNSTHVYITADHGFLYTGSPLREEGKVNKSTNGDEEVEYGRRYVITKKGVHPDYLLPVRFLDGETDFEAFAPRESIRIRMNGAGMNFVHGGASLQEMVVPLLDYRFFTNRSKEYQQNKGKYDKKPVTIGLLSSARKISNMIIALNFYQKESVGTNRMARNYLVYFEDGDGNRISDEQKIIADRNFEEGQDQTFRVRFSLKQQKYSTSQPYYLVMESEDGLDREKVEFHIDIPLSLDEFNFF